MAPNDEEVSRALTRVGAELAEAVNALRNGAEALGMDTAALNMYNKMYN